MTAGTDTSDLSRRLAQAIAFGEKLGLDTYDPNDTKGSPLGMWLYGGGTPVRKVLRKGFNAVDLLAPMVLRRVLGVRKERSHGGVARWVQALLTYSELTREERYRTEAFRCLQWLAENAVVTPVGKGWGFPFDWQTFVFVPKGTGIGHTTMSVLNAFLAGLESGGSEELWGEIEAGCQFLAEGLNQTKRPSGAIALSYTPLDHSQVMNTNAEIAAVLAHVGRVRGREDWRELAKDLALFVVETQNEDGSWYYAAVDSSSSRPVVDNYHTGMILDALMILSQEFEGDAEQGSYISALNTGLAFHLVRHFEEDGCPKMRPDERYPVDAYSGGEGLLCLTKAMGCAYVQNELRESSKEVLARLAGYMTSPAMMAEDGCFYYRSWGRVKMRLESMRWAQSVVCHGLAEYLLARTASDSVGSGERF